MKKIILASALSSILAASLFAGSELVKIKQAEVDSLSKQLSTQFKTDLKITKAQKIGSMYQLEVRPSNNPAMKNQIFIEPKSGLTIAGAAFNKSGEPIVLPIDIDTVKKGISFKSGNGSKEIYVITDPECPYCQQFEKAAEGKLSDYKVNYILMPLSFHKNATPMSQWILSGKNDAEKAERLSKVMKGDTTWKTEKLSNAAITKANEIISKGNSAALELGARGTPTVLDSNFKQIDWPSLVK